MGQTLDNRYKNSLDKFIEKKGLEDIIELKDFMPRKDVFSILQKSAIFVQPSFFEGCSIALMEAISSGLPVIVSDVGSARELVNKNVGLIIPAPADPYSLSVSNIDRLSKDFNLPSANDLADAIVNMLSNIDDWNSKREKRIEYIKKFSIKKMIERYKEIYKTIV